MKFRCTDCGQTFDDDRDCEGDACNRCDNDGEIVRVADDSAEGSGDCLFPGECCMPGDHTPDECHTAEMIESQYAEPNSVISQNDT